MIDIKIKLNQEVLEFNLQEEWDLLVFLTDLKHWAQASLKLYNHYTH